MPPKHKLIRRTRLIDNTTPTDVVSANQVYVDPTPNSLQEKRRQHFKLTHQSSAPDAIVDAAIAKEDYDRVRRSPQERATVGANPYARWDRDALRAAGIIYTPEDIEQAKQLAEAHNAAIGNPLVPQTAPAISPEQAERNPAYVKDVIKQDALSMASTISVPGVTKGINWITPRIVPAATNTARFVTRAMTPSEYFNGLGYYLPRFSSQLQTIGKLANVGAAGYFTKQGIDDIVENGLTPTNTAETVLGVGGLGFELAPAIMRGYNAARNVGTNIQRRAVETAMRTTDLKNPIPEIISGFKRTLSDSYEGGIPRLLNIGKYILTGQRTGPKGYYNSLAEYFNYNTSSPKTNTFLNNLFRPSGQSRAYTGFLDGLAYRPYIKFEGNDYIDAFLYNKTIDPRYGLRLVDTNDFGVHSNYIANRYGPKASQIKIYEPVSNDSRVVSQIDKSKLMDYKVTGGEGHKISFGSFDPDGNWIIPNVGGHQVESGVYNRNLYVREQDIWKFNPEDYINRNLPNFQSLPKWKQGLLKYGLKKVDQLGTPVITRTPWRNEGNVDEMIIL